MEFWNNITNVSLLGTDKKQLAASDLPESLNVVFTQLEQLNKEPEEKFLSLTAVASNYRRSGLLPFNIKQLSIAPSSEEEKKYCSRKAMRSLQTVLSEENNSLLCYWLRWCLDCDQVVQPELIPQLLELAVQKKELREAIVTVCGKRGAWLSEMNEAWNFYKKENPAEVWQTGTPAARKEVLQQLIKTDPQQARELLHATWNEEPANNKTDFLKIFSTNVSADDISWLENLGSEKSQKVREAALELLKQIPLSTVVQLYWNTLKNAITLKSGKAFLGMLNKVTLEINTSISFDEELFKTGIDKLSNNKQFTDEEFIIYQLLSSIPTKNLEQHFNESPGKIIDHFKRSQEKFLPAIIIATKQFKDAAWAKVLLDQTENPDVTLIPLLPEGQREKYLFDAIPNFPTDAFRVTPENMNEWSRSFAKKIYAAMAQESYSKTFFRDTIALVPVEIMAELDSMSPENPVWKIYWTNTSEEIKRLLTIKQQIIQSFTL